jgi:hypothetical protein
MFLDLNHILVFHSYSKGVMSKFTLKEVLKDEHVIKTGTVMWEIAFIRSNVFPTHKGYTWWKFPYNEKLASFNNYKIVAKIFLFRQYFLEYL